MVNSGSANLRNPVSRYIYAFVVLVMSTAVALPGEASGGADMVEELEERFGIIVDAPQKLSSADIESILRGAQSLPKATWDIIDGPLAVEYVEQSCLFGMGRYNTRCPTFDEGKKRFFIYDSPAVVGEGPVERLDVLNEVEQRDIQVRRAIVHMALVHLDDKLEWSKSRQWRTINGWPGGSGKALNHDPWGYSRYLGMRSAHLDLVTFGEEFLVRPEDLLLERAGADDDIRGRLDDIDPNQTVRCQQFTHRRVLAQKFADIENNWSEPERRLPHVEAGDPVCPAFEQWARPELVAGFDLLLAAATANQPESLFGHLLLHVRYETDGRVRGEGFEPVYQFGAITDTDVDPVQYVTRGILGGFPSILELNTFRGVDRLFLQYQQRNLRRFTLKLTDEQSVQFLERIWEAERRIRYPYMFFANNCASFLTDLLAPAVDLPMPRRRNNIVMPTDVLDTLAQVENGDLGSLLEKRSDTLRSNREIAEEAVVQRRELFRELRSKVEFDKETKNRFTKIINELDDSQPTIRQAAYGGAQEIFEALLEEQPKLSRSIIDFLYYSVLVERYFMEMAYFARRTVYAGVQRSPEPQSVEDQLRQRRDLYRIEELEARIDALNAMSSDTEARLTQQPLREFTEEESQILGYEERTRNTYMTALETQADAIDRYMPDWSGVEYLGQRQQDYYEERQRVDELSVGPSGRNRVTVGSSWDFAAGYPTLEISYSTMEEWLGELRRRGYRGDLGTRILGLDLSIPFEPTGLQDLELDLVLLRYESLQQTQGPLNSGWFDTLGWGLDVRIVHDGRRDLWAGVELTPSIYLPIWSGQNNIHHLVAHTGVAIRHDIHSEQQPLLGAAAGLFGQVHLYGNYGNVFRFGVDSGQYIGVGPQWRFDLRARAESRHTLLYMRQRPLMLVPFFEGLWTTRDYREDAPDQGFESWKTGVGVELPF